MIEERINDNDPICEKLYVTNDNQQYTVIQQLLTLEECDEIIKEGRKYASKNNWTRKRHSQYPTTDNQITFEWNVYDLLEKRVCERVFKEIADLFSVKEENIGINEMFIAKYEKDKQNKLKAHEDGSEFSFIIGLNDDYEGGGTYFTKLKKLVKLQKGDCLVFSGQNRHRGEPVTDGKRYIVTGFLHYVKEHYCCSSYIDIIEPYLGGFIFLVKS